MKWSELNASERANLINEHIFAGNSPIIPYFNVYSDESKFALLEFVMVRMEEIDCPFTELVWMYPRRNPGEKQFGAKFWCKKLNTESWGFAANPADAMLEAAVLAALGRLSL